MGDRGVATSISTLYSYSNTMATASTDKDKAQPVKDVVEDATVDAKPAADTPEVVDDAPASPADTIRPSPPETSTGEQASTTAQRAFQDGIKRENLEHEVEQVMGTLNSWWGGVKKQVGWEARRVVCIYTDPSPPAHSQPSKPTSTRLFRKPKLTLNTFALPKWRLWPRRTTQSQRRCR